MASSSTFVPLTASRCASPEARNVPASARRSGRRGPAPCPPAARPRRAGRARANPASARRRTASSAPARPPRRSPVDRERRPRRTAASAPRRRWYLVEGVRLVEPPATARTSPGAAAAAAPGCGPAPRAAAARRRPRTRAPTSAARRPARASGVQQRRAHGARRPDRVAGRRPASIAARRASAPAAPPSTRARRAARDAGPPGDAQRHERRPAPAEPRRPAAAQQPGHEGEEHDVPRVARARLVRSRRDVVAQRFQRRRSDPGDLVELLDAREAALFRAVVEDALGGDRPDAVECVELLERRRVQVDRAGRRRPRRPARRRPPGTRTGTTIWRPSSSSWARLTWCRSPRRVAPPARRSASVDPCARPQPIDAGPRTAPATCTTTWPPLAPRTALELDRSRRGGRAVVSPRGTRPPRARRSRAPPVPRPRTGSVGGGADRASAAKLRRRCDGSRPDSSRNLRRLSCRFSGRRSSRADRARRSP